jgi:hypothetical protein
MPREGAALLPGLLRRRSASQRAVRFPRGNSFEAFGLELPGLRLSVPLGSPRVCVPSRARPPASWTVPTRRNEVARAWPLNNPRHRRGRRGDHRRLEWRGSSGLAPEEIPGMGGRVDNASPADRASSPIGGGQTMVGISTLLMDRRIILRLGMVDDERRGGLLRHKLKSARQPHPGGPFGVQHARDELLL